MARAISCSFSESLVNLDHIFPGLSVQCQCAYAHVMPRRRISIQSFFGTFYSIEEGAASSGGTVLPWSISSGVMQSSCLESVNCLGKNCPGGGFFMERDFGRFRVSSWPIPRRRSTKGHEPGLALFVRFRGNSSIVFILQT
jgi:hypothetical protein